MITTVKTFNFNPNPDGWVSVIGATNISAYHRVRDASRHSPGGPRGDAPTSVFAGALIMSARRNNIKGQNYWELTTTWENLGVPAGHTINTVKLDYLFRWEAKNHGSGKPIWKSSAEFTGSDVIAGPAEIFDADEDIINTFSTGSNCIDRTIADLWNAYPSGTQIYYQPISQLPMWKEAIGTEIDVSTPVNSTLDSTPSNSTVKFRIKNTLPTLPDHDFNVATQWLRLKNDAITITITSFPPESNSSPLILFSD